MEEENVLLFVYFAYSFVRVWVGGSLKEDKMAINILLFEKRKENG